jgi:formate/nitrite transporter FocA (FNT family)
MLPLFLFWIMFRPNAWAAPPVPGTRGRVRALVLLVNTKGPRMTYNDIGKKQTEPSEPESDEKNVRNATALPPKMIYEIIRRDGEEELKRPLRSLLWSGIAAGLLISFSVLGEAIFRTYLPDTPWRHLVENIGYSFGFMLVIMGRMQLFTENTITTVLPFTVKRTRAMFVCLIRLWSVVLAMNVIGALGAAALFAHTPAIPSELLPAITELSQHALGFTPSEAFFRGIPAGILVASIVWMMPQAETSAFWIILLFTWLIAAGDFTHIVAGSVEMWFLALTGGTTFNTALLAFFLPVLAGNVIGGTAIFTMLAWGQVRDEIPDDTEEGTHATMPR